MDHLNLRQEKNLAKRVDPETERLGRRLGCSQRRGLHPLWLL